MPLHFRYYIHKTLKNIIAVLKIKVGGVKITQEINILKSFILAGISLYVITDVQRIGDSQFMQADKIDE